MFVCAAVIYLLLNFILVRLFAAWEKRLSHHLRPRPTLPNNSDTLLRERE